MEFFQGLDWGAYYHFQFMRSPALDPVMMIGHWLGSPWTFLFLVALGLGLHASKSGKAGVLRLAAVVLAGCAAIEVLRRLGVRDRPDSAFGLVGEAEMALSFPSRSVFLATLGLFLVASALEDRCRSWMQLISLTVLVAALVSWVAFSQLYLSLHYVTDVIAGLLAGMGVGLLCRQIGGVKQSVR